MEEKNRKCRRTQGQNGELLERELRGNPPNWQKVLRDASRLNSKGSCNAERGRRGAGFYLATYNTRTLRTTEQIEELIKEIDNIQWSVVGSCETKRSGEWLTEMKDGSWIFDCGRSEDRPEAKGIAILINKKFKDFVSKFEVLSDRVISCNVNVENNKTLKIIQVYAPTSTADEEEIDKLYETIDRAIDKRCIENIIMGDFNAKIGRKQQWEKGKCTGGFGIGGKK